MRVRPAMSFADSILQTASIARLVAESVTHTNQRTRGRLFKLLGRRMRRP
jgi:hypothetical protein